jgi:hypothetical protein
MSPFRALESALGPLGGRTIALPGLERFWVSQKKDNLCWAAAIEIVRGYLHLRHVTHLTMPATVAKECPKLLNQTKGAELFQIAFVISKFNRLYDNSRLAPHACSTEQCVIESIQRGRPAIALKSAHAVVIQAVEIADGAPDAIWRYKILDPAGDGKIETREPLEMCTADAFIAF